MLKLRDALGAFAPGEGAGSVDPVAVLAAGWPEIVGENNARNSRPSQIADETLWVTTTSGARSEELANNAPLLLERIAARLPKAGIAKLRFRVGKVATSIPSAVRRAGASPRDPVESRPESQTAKEALERYRDTVGRAQRAKRDRGWKECRECSALVAPESGPFCVPCALARAQERERLLSRLLFEAPWLGFAGTARLIEDVSEAEYADIRHRLLARWWDRLCRAQRTGKHSRDASERMLASSYVLLKSERPPERIDPAIVRQVLGAELHDFIYGTERQQ